MPAELVIVDDKAQFSVPTGKRLHYPANAEFDGLTHLKAAGGADAANALLLGIGTSAIPATTATADKCFIEMRTQSSATSGTSRGLYWRHNLSGAGQSGEAVRAFTDLTAAVGTARGAQVSLQAGSTGYVTGLGVGVDAQLYVKNSAVPANGTYAAINAEIYSEGASSSVAAPTEVSFIRVVNAGNATGMGTVDDKAFLFSLNGFTSGAAKVWYDHQGSAPANIEEWLKVKTPAGTRWLPLYNAVV